MTEVTPPPLQLGRATAETAVGGRVIVWYVGADSRPAPHHGVVTFADVGADGTHPALCLRCVANVAGPGEERRYA